VSPLALLLASSLALLPRAPGGGDDKQASPDRLLTPRVERMVEKAHAFLIDHQNADGSFSIVRNDASTSAPVAVTSLAVMSFMASGHLPDRGSHKLAVQRAVDWLVGHCGEDGYFTTDGDKSEMHGQGYAVLALAQVFGMDAGDQSKRDALRGAIERGVQLIESSQGETNGWWYEPRRVAEHEGSITVCMIQALRAARDVGFAVDKGVIDRAQSYVQRSQNEDGRFRYALNDSKTSWALTAAALATLNSIGQYSGEPLERGFEALQRSDPFTGSANWSENFVDYGALYAAQAYWQRGDQRAFDRWWPAFVADREQSQYDDGHFNGGEHGTVYGTAIVSLTLQVPLGYLPLFQR
jgi:prenyltransferase beta subunit